MVRARFCCMSSFVLASAARRSHCPVSIINRNTSLPSTMHCFTTSNVATLQYGTKMSTKMKDTDMIAAFDWCVLCSLLSCGVIHLTTTAALHSDRAHPKKKLSGCGYTNTIVALPIHGFEDWQRMVHSTAHTSVNTRPISPPCHRVHP